MIGKNKILNLAYDLGWACMGWAPDSINNFHVILPFLVAKNYFSSVFEQRI